MLSLSAMQEKTCTLCGEFFTSRLQRNGHKCPCFNNTTIQTRMKQIDDDSSASSSATCSSTSPVKPSNYKLSLNGGRVEMSASYQCDLCPSSKNHHFNTIQDLNQHRDNAHMVTHKELLEKKRQLARRIGVSPTNKRESATSLQCSKCDLLFNSVSECRRHIIAYHVTPTEHRNYIPAHQQYQTTMQPSDQEPIVTAQEEGPSEEGGSRYSCTLCDESFNRRDFLFDHTANVHNKRLLYECSFCEKMFVDRLLLNKHLQSHKQVSDEYSPTEAFECHFCGKQFPFESHFKRHLATHTGSAFFSCDICGDDFRSQNQLVLHRAEHTGDDRFPCSICKKKFAYRSLLARHMKTHHGEPESCRRCGKTFNVASLLQSHMQNEHGDPERLLSCAVCDKTFQYPCYLERHMATHSVRKYHNCPMCERTFTQRAALLAHLECHLPRSEEVDAQAASKMFKCQVCRRVYKRESALEKHFNEYHSSTQPQQGSDGQQESSVLIDGPNVHMHLVNAQRVRSNSGNEYLAIPLNLD